MSPEEQLLSDIGGFFSDPLGFVRYAYTWGEGELQGFRGPDSWQESFMREWGEEIKLRNFNGRTAVMPIQFSTVSGHGIGKSAQTGWGTDFIMSTRPFSKGIVTANTSAQLETKTWAEISKWTRRCITGHWFRITTGRGAMKMVHKDFEDAWRCDGIAWRENAPEAFAGQHAVNATSFYIFDEASAIPEPIFQTAQGGLTDGEPMMFLFGNGTKNSGFFFETHHKFRDSWKRFQVDARTSSISNKDLHKQWIDEWGEDSDFVKIRVLGQFPNASSTQFIPRDVVQRAALADMRPNDSDPLIMGVDPARFGGDETVIRFRQGRNARAILPTKLKKLDTMQVASRVVELDNKYKPDAIFIDGNGLGGGVVDRCRQLNCDVIEVNSSFKAGSREYRIKGDEMWGLMRDWLKEGAAIDGDKDLETDLISREYFFDNKNRIALESKDDMKSRGLASPNNADALALTFAMPVGPRDPNKNLRFMKSLIASNINRPDWDYDPYQEAYPQ